MKDLNTLWWSREDLSFNEQGKLCFAGKDLALLAKQNGTPSFYYSLSRVKDNFNRLSKALDGEGLVGKYNFYYAMKANRFMPLLLFLKQQGICGIDACSPKEVERAIQCGFSPEQISFTATNISKDDFERLSRYQGLIFNADSLHSIKKWGESHKGQEIGLRINPAIGIGRHQNKVLHYSGENTTKFGIYKEQLDEALALAAQYELKVTRLHFHAGCGFLSEQLPVLESILDEVKTWCQKIKTIETVNIGGGLGVPHIETDTPLDLKLWSKKINEFVAGTNLKISIEPGDYIAKDAGVLLVEVNAVEKKKDRKFVGVNAGFNLAPEPAYYDLPFQIVPVSKGDSSEKVDVVGNINEALDVWYRDIELPEMQEGDILAILNAGAYSASMSSNHCMRGSVNEFLLVD